MMRASPSRGFAGERRLLAALASGVVVIGLVIVGVMGVLMMDGSSSGFISRRDQSFMRDGAPFRPIGVNLYSAAGDPAIFECGPKMENPEVELDEVFRRIKAETGATVVRFWAFQSYTNGGTDWSALDRVIRLAKAHDLLLLPVLENQWVDCTQGGPRDASWYAERYRQPDGAHTLSYDVYVRRIVERYRDEPAIFAWMLMNEAEARRPDGSGDPDALYTFAEGMSRLVKEIDRRHLVGLGLIGRGQPGASAPNFERLHALPTIDFVSYHDYLAESVALPGAHLEVAVFRQEQDWAWQNGPYVALLGQRWEHVESQTTGRSGAPAPRRLGLTMFGDFVGDIYVDQIHIGQRVYDFEDGTAQGWRVDGASAPEPTTARVGSGRHALRVRVSGPADGAQIWIEAPPGLEANPTISASLFLETPGAAPPPNTLAAAVVTAATLKKPLLVSESGIPTCSPPPGATVQHPDQRAVSFDRKLEAFFAVGGAGYLIWDWDTSASCPFSVTSGDPLNRVLKAWSERLSRR